MSPDYTWSVEGDAYRCLVTLSRRRRKLLERAVEELAAQPFRPALFSERSPEGERLDMIEAAGYLITYHADHAVRRIRVTEITPIL